MSIYQHFRPEEKEFIDQVLNWKEAVENAYAPKLTDFLDPREQEIARTIIGNQTDVKIDFFGGTDGTERKRAFLYPEYHQLAADDFEICLYELDYPKKFITIEHPQVLGSLMSLGLKRGKFGDILVFRDRIQFFVTKDVAEYISLQLESVGRAKVSLIQQPIAHAIQLQEQWQEIVVTSTSLRLDTVISAVHNLSRQKSQMFIQQGLVKVNWMIIENTAFECRESDVISVRGYGRLKIISLDGKTKKERWRITAGKVK
ncbi:RNA-binding protein YlmH [Cytobacillus eiseniae]|uniref:RNA-binding protein YlmH n=1 Tax=Cytobacillus eiseniae TaxID=762947 RepID=A0ABS4RBG2_9BACI|nr:RNA-binding protein [Cytobacillus eiseniae]MBP2240053.1 RNA-binding protein YlmH [Cytobacillus eiseniae]